MVCASAAFCQNGEEANFTDFNWHTLLGLDSPEVMKKLWEHAQAFKEEAYNKKAILDLVLTIYAKGKDLEQSFPFDNAIESRSKYN